MPDFLDAAENDRDELVARLQDLVRIDTRNPYSGDADAPGEAAGQEYLEPVLRQMGAGTRMFDCPDDIYERMSVIGPADRDFSGRPNLVAEWDFGDGPRVVINGHMDTVGANAMEIEPFSGEVRDGAVWGRGTSDCKGGIAIGVEAIRLLLDSGIDLGGTLVFESVVDEECSGSGAGTLACLDAGYTGDVAVFVDGNDLAVTLGCGGCLTADLRVEGREGHAARGTGVSAIDRGMLVKQAIDEFKAERESARPNCRVNIGIFRSGVHAAVVPGTAYLSLNIVYDVEEAEAAREAGHPWGAAPVRERFEEVIRAAEAEDEWLAEHPSEITWVKDLVPFDQPEDDPWAQRLASAMRQELGRDPEFNRMMAWSDAAFPAALGGIPALLFGPALAGEPHGPTEHIMIDDMVGCSAALAAVLADTLGG
ncbi:MAG: M20 family metallopeptidase [Armatimonadota bacterium]